MIDFRPILNICGMLLLIMAIAMIFPALVDIADKNDDAGVFFFSSAITSFIGGSLYLATRSGKTEELSRRQAFALTTFAWVSVSLAGSLPFLIYGDSLALTDAIFESVSGITTTGATVMSGLDTQPVGILFWRHLLQWIGGIGIILMAIIMLPFLGVGGMQLFETESSERSGRIVPRARQFVVYISVIYSGLTFIAMMVYLVLGMGAFDALCHAMSSIATAGFSTHDASFGYFESPALQWAGAFFMLAGAIPFVAYIRFVRGHKDAIYKDVQVRGFLGFLLVVIVCFGLWLTTTPHASSLEEGLRMAAFNIVSVVTTTGFSTEDYTLWGTTSIGLFFALMFVGGCAGSTTGGIKIYRHQILWASVRSYLRQLISPHRMDVQNYGGIQVTREVRASILAFLAVFVGVFSVTAVVLAAMGLDFVTAMSASATAINNVGPGIGDIIGPKGNFAPLPDGAKWVLSGAMLLGRLELFTVLILFEPDFWRG